VTYRIKVNGRVVDDSFYDPNAEPKCPLITIDTPGVVSPIDDTWIEGRYARREHMKKHNVREIDPSEKPEHRYTHPARQHLNKD
jgi:hypothetical protein